MKVKQIPPEQVKTYLEALRQLKSKSMNQIEDIFKFYYGERFFKEVTREVADNIIEKKGDDGIYSLGLIPTDEMITGLAYYLLYELDDLSIDDLKKDKFID